MSDAVANVVTLNRGRLATGHSRWVGIEGVETVLATIPDQRKLRNILS